MPEILTKYPESALKVLKSAGAKCGEGAKQQILTKCPTEDFCSLPGGEICIYGVNNVAKMTQIGQADLVEYTQYVPTIYSNFNIVLLIVSCLFGMGMGMLFSGNKKRKGS